MIIHLLHSKKMCLRFSRTRSPQHVHVWKYPWQISLVLLGGAQRRTAQRTFASTVIPRHFHSQYNYRFREWNRTAKIMGPSEAANKALVRHGKNTLWHWPQRSLRHRRDLQCKWTGIYSTTSWHPSSRWRTGARMRCSLEFWSVYRYPISL